MRAQELEVLARSSRLFLRSNSNLILYTEQGSCPAHVRPWHHFARILQTKAEPCPSHSGPGRHNYAVSVARIYLTKRSARPSRIGHIGGSRRRDPLCCDLGSPPLLVPAEARQAAYADTDDAVVPEESLITPEELFRHYNQGYKRTRDGGWVPSKNPGHKRTREK